MAEPEKIIPAVTHEPGDVSGRFILGAVGMVLGTLLVIALGVLIAFPLSHLDWTLASKLPVYPEPRLQPSPRQDMQRFRASEMQQLNGTGWIDQSAGIAHIPIGDAMRKIAHDGIPGWPARSDEPR
jgi:predicted outer membrane lipoprotein